MFVFWTLPYVDYDQILRTLQSIHFANIVEPKINTSIIIKFKAECINWSVYLYKDVMFSYTVLMFLLPNTMHRVKFYNTLTYHDSLPSKCIPTFQVLILCNINQWLPTFPKYTYWKRSAKGITVQQIIRFFNSNVSIICINRITIIKVTILSLWYLLSKTLVDHQSIRPWTCWNTYFSWMEVLYRTQVTNTAVICNQLRSPML